MLVTMVAHALRALREIRYLRRISDPEREVSGTTRFVGSYLEQQGKQFNGVALDGRQSDAIRPRAYLPFASLFLLRPNQSRSGKR
jgi:hypothetical protein